MLKAGEQEKDILQTLAKEVLKKYGEASASAFVPFQVYATQFFVALQHLKFCNVIHADIKPDNILANDEKNPTVVKICDLGSAMTGEEKTTDAVPGFEILSSSGSPSLGCDTMCPWTSGASDVPLRTLHRKDLFPGRTNNEMLKYMMDYKGPFPKKLLRRGIFSSQAL
eukprot:jgi/Pico_ML_1/54720/g593.t1